jgi:hypothetical protein
VNVGDAAALAVGRMLWDDCIASRRDAATTIALILIVIDDFVSMDILPVLSVSRLSHVVILYFLL